MTAEALEVSTFSRDSRLTCIAGAICVALENISASVLGQHSQASAGNMDSEVPTISNLCAMSHVYILQVSVVQHLLRPI